MSNLDISQNITITTWNANCIDRLTINTVTDSLYSSSLIFCTETWLLSPLRLPTNWIQYHTYGLPVPGMVRGQMGISLLVNPNFPYPVRHIQSDSPYVLSCQVDSILIHCVYLPPSASMSDSTAINFLRDLPLHSHSSQTQTIFCGDLNARHVQLLGDLRTTPRGTLLNEWLVDTGLICWNASLAFGIPTHTKQCRKAVSNTASSNAASSSVVDYTPPLLLSGAASGGSGFGAGVSGSGSGLLSGVLNTIDPDIIQDDPVINSGAPELLNSPLFDVNSSSVMLSDNERDETDDGEDSDSAIRSNEQISYISYASGSVIDLFISSHDLIHASMQVRTDLTIDSDHHPVTLSFVLPSAPPLRVDHPRKLWKLSKLSETDCQYAAIFGSRIGPFQEMLSGLLTRNDCPNFNELNDTLVDTIHSSLDDSVGRQTPTAPGNSWFWTSELQNLCDFRETQRRRWARAPSLGEKCSRWRDYITACKAFKLAVKRRRRVTWKQFCNKLAFQPLSETTAQIKKITRGRAISPSYTHPEGAQAAAESMAQHLRGVFRGDSLLPSRQPHPPPPPVPHSIDENVPFSENSIRYHLCHSKAKRKAPGSDHLRAEMFVPIQDFLVPVLYLFFKLCWRWSCTPKSWRTAQVVPIFKKGDPSSAANFRPISLTSHLRKLLERCVEDELKSSSPTLDIVQGGFRTLRGATDQALCLHELCVHHTLDYGSPPVLAFLDIKSAYDTVDRAIVWRVLETHVSDPLLGLLQNLFDDVSLQILVGGAESDPFPISVGLMQGSILSPHLYSLYINSLPGVIREPFSSRVLDPPPRRYNNLWLNSLLFADDVVIIGTAESMPLLLARAEEHSIALGYRWNPLKCVVVNSNSTSLTNNEVPQLSLYGQAIPTADSFNYLGVPFNSSGNLDLDLLLSRNTQSALSSMRGLQSLGLHTSGFSRLLSAFIRPKFEYGLCVSWFLKKHLKLLEKSQDQCLRIAFGGHRTSSTAVFRQMTGLPTMAERYHILVFKFLFRVHNLIPDDTLLHSLLPTLTSPRHRLLKLAIKNDIWLSDHVGASINIVAPLIKTYRQDTHSARLNPSRPNVTAPVLLSACRPKIMVDPVLYLPMTVFERSRIVRWRMGWLPARPVACRCGAPHASRTHLFSCLNVASRLTFSGKVPGGPNPLDYFLNLLPTKKPRLSLDPQDTSSCLRSKAYAFWFSRWPVLCAILLEIDQICHPDEEFSGRALQTSGLKFLRWLDPATDPARAGHTGIPSLTVADPLLARALLQDDDWLADPF